MAKKAERRFPVSQQTRDLIATAQQDVAAAQERLNLILSTVFAGAKVRAQTVGAMRIVKEQGKWWLVYATGTPPTGGKES